MSNTGTLTSHATKILLLMDQASNTTTYHVKGKTEIRQFGDVYSQNPEQIFSWYTLITLSNF